MGSIRLTILAFGLFGAGAIGSQQPPPTGQLVLFAEAFWNQGRVPCRATQHHELSDPCAIGL